MMTANFLRHDRERDGRPHERYRIPAATAAAAVPERARGRGRVHRLPPVMKIGRGAEREYPIVLIVSAHVQAGQQAPHP